MEFQRLIRTVAALATTGVLLTGCRGEPAAPVTPVAANSTAVSRSAVTIERDSVIGVRLNHALDSSSARVDDFVSASVSRDVVAAGRTVIPVGARLEGSIVLIDRNLEGLDRARIGVRFHTLVTGTPDRIAIRTEPILRLGGSPAAPSQTFTAFTGATAAADVHIPAGSYFTIKLTEAVTIDR